MEIQKQESFQNWLPNNGVHGGSINSYVSRLKTIERCLNDDIDSLIESDEFRLLDRINQQTISHVSDGTLRDMKAAVKKYCKCFYPNSKIIAMKH